MTKEDLNQHHMKHPKPGDFWHKSNNEPLLVLDVKHDRVVICDKKMEVDPDHWTFDVRTYKTISRSELKSRVCCKQNTHFVSQVLPRRGIESAEEWRLMHRKSH